MDEHKTLRLKPLLLAGGKSTRMGSPKHSLCLPDGTLLYKHLVDLLHHACPESEQVYISLAKGQSLPSTGHAGESNSKYADGAGIEIIFDLEANTERESTGPAAGLLAAFDAYRDSTWLVVACDYPLLTLTALEMLRKAYVAPVTCFLNGDGFVEPLVGIWSPDALAVLKGNVAQGRSGPSRVVRQLTGRTISPPGGCGEWLVNVNTRTEWNDVLSRFHEEPACED
jgi:molybdopterin-guanine dinucleotide biosynthesis protein A